MPTLQDITNSLQQINASLGSLSPEDKAKFEASTSSDTLKGGLGEIGGALSSDRAAEALKRANGNLNAVQYSSIVAPTEQQVDSQSSKWLREISLANERAQTAKQEADKALEAQKNAEANASIADQRLANNQPVVTKTDTTTNGSQNTAAPATQTTLTPQDVTDYGLTPDQLKDPFVVAQVEASKNKQATITNTVNDIAAFNRNQDEIANGLIANIKAQTEAARISTNAEYANRARAVQYAGIISGVSAYSPEEHEGLISEVVMNGKAKLAEIDLKANEVMLNMRRDYAKENFERYMKGVDALSKLDDLKVETMSAISSHLQNIEKSQREKMVFDQQQQDRLALQIGETLIGKSNAEIMDAAKKNGIEYGALLKSVRDATYTREKRALDLAPKKVTDTIPDDVERALGLAGLSKPETETFWSYYRGVGIDAALTDAIENKNMPAGRAKSIVAALYDKSKVKVDGVEQPNPEEIRLNALIDSVSSKIPEVKKNVAAIDTRLFRNNPTLKPSELRKATGKETRAAEIRKAPSK